MIERERDENEKLKIREIEILIENKKRNFDKMINYEEILRIKRKSTFYNN